jgi:transcriptional regulator with XRE-family HTH domain
MKEVRGFANFGEFLTAKREERDLTLREMARQMGVSAPFLSDVEKNRSAPLTKERLDKVAEILHFDTDEKTAMYDLVGRQRNTVAPDLPEYIIGRDYVAAALRTARDLNAGEAEWLRFVEELKKREG